MWNVLSHSRWGAGVWVLFWKERTGSYIHVLSLYFPGERVSWLSEMSPLLKDHWVRLGRTDDVTLFVNRMKLHILDIFIYSVPRTCLDTHVIVNHVNKRLCSVQLRLLRFPRGSLFSISGSDQHSLYFLCGIRVSHLNVNRALRLQTAYRSETATRFTFSSTFQCTLCSFFICRKVCETETDVTTNTYRLWSYSHNCTWSQMLEVLSKYEILRVSANSLRLVQTSEQRHLLLRRGTSLSLSSLLCLSAGSLDYSNTSI